MNNNEIRTRLIAVVKELEKIEVRGQINMASLLGSINYLNQMVNELSEPAEATEE